MDKVGKEEEFIHPFCMCEILAVSWIFYKTKKNSV